MIGIFIGNLIPMPKAWHDKMFNIGLRMGSYTRTVILGLPPIPKDKADDK